MHSTILTYSALSFSASFAVATTCGSIVPIDQVVTDNVFELSVHQNPRNLSPPSTQHLARRRIEANREQQNIPIAPASENLIDIGGRIYIANVTFGGQKLSLVLDSGSSDTWAVTTDFQCQDAWGNNAALGACRFGGLYDRAASTTWRPISYVFAVDYQGNEYVDGDTGTEIIGIGGISTGWNTSYINVNQTIGAVTSGFWLGDGISAGLMGLAYPALATGVNNLALNYTSIMYTIFQNSSIPPVFSLALNRPTTSLSRAGGLLAIGGIPDVPNDGRWVTTPVLPFVSGIYAFYAINIDGFDITPPSSNAILGLLPSINPYFISKQNMIVDSGTSLMSLPDAVAQYIGSLFSPPARYDSYYNTYLVPCTARAPRVGIRIGGQSYFLADDDLMNRGPGAVGGRYAGARIDECVLAVQNAMGGTLVLGDAWMKNVVVVFDVANGTDYGPGGSEKLKNGGGSLRIVGRETY